ncbi:MAG: lipopolysaccharide heptosyltransferase I [Candidatus Muiribacteriota bacterium]
MKICIVKLSSLGDIIHSMIVLQFIKKNYPEYQIHWICSKKFEGILKYNPDITKLHTIFTEEEKNLWRTFKKLKKISAYEKFDLVIDMQGLLKSAIVSRILGKNTWGFAKKSAREPLSSIFYKNQVQIPYKENIYIRNLTLVSKALDFNFTEEELLNKKNYLYHSNEYLKLVDDLIKTDRKNIVFIPSATTPERVIPPQKYAEIINRLDYKCFITWGSANEKLNAEIIAQKSHAQVLPKLTLSHLIYLFSKVDLIIGPDTGPSNIPFAINKPSITLYWDKAKNSYKRNSYETEINKALSFENLSELSVKKVLKLIEKLIF